MKRRRGPRGPFRDSYTKRRSLLKSRGGSRLPYDHRHQTSSDEGVPYAIESAYRLLEDFFAELDRVIKEAQQ